MLQAIKVLQIINMIVVMIDVVSILSMIIEVNLNSCDKNFYNDKFDLLNLFIGFANTHCQNVSIFVFQTLEWQAILYVLEAEKDLKVEEITFHVNQDER